MTSFIFYFLICFAVTTIVGGIVIAIIVVRDINEQDKELEDKVNDSLKKGNRLN